MEDEKREGRREQIRQGRRHLEKGTQRFLKGGGEKLDYYRENRSELIDNLSRRFGDPRKPAAAGTIVLAPVLVVILVVAWLFEKIAVIPGSKYFNISSALGVDGIAKFYLDQTFKLSILLLTAAILVTGVGRFVNTRYGFKLEKLLDAAFDRIPFLGTVYSITKVSTETVLGGAEDFSRPVKLDFNGIRITGFKTGKKADDGRDIIFVPTAPNITSGFVVELEPGDYQEVDETAESALTRVLSAGFGHQEVEPGPEEDGETDPVDEDTEM